MLVDKLPWPVSQLYFSPFFPKISTFKKLIAVFDIWCFYIILHFTNISFHFSFLLLRFFKLTFYRDLLETYCDISVH